MWVILPDCRHTSGKMFTPSRVKPAQNTLQTQIWRRGTGSVPAHLASVSPCHRWHHHPLLPPPSSLNVSCNESLIGSSQQRYRPSHACGKSALVNIESSSKYWIHDWLNNSIWRLSCRKEQTLITQLIGLLNSARLHHPLSLGPAPAGCCQGHYSNLN